MPVISPSTIRRCAQVERSDPREGAGVEVSAVVGGGVGHYFASLDFNPSSFGEYASINDSLHRSGV